MPPRWALGYKQSHRTLESDTEMLGIIDTFRSKRIPLDAVIYLGKLMKTFYGNWNKETLDDSVILRDIQAMSGGALNMTIEKVREDNLFEKLYKERKKVRPQGQGPGQGQGHRGS